MVSQRSRRPDDRPWLKEGLKLGLCVMTFSLLAACSPAAPPVATANTPASQNAASPELSTQATLDWDAATITLPLDRYGMSLHEQQVVDAAGSIEFARCAKADVASAATEAGRYLATVPMSNHWLFGWWDANYIAKNGFHGVTDIPLTWAEASDAVTKACRDQINADGLTPVFVGYAGNTESDIISTGSWDADDQTTADARFKSLQKKWRDCVAAAGYKIDTGYSTTAAWIDPHWTHEQTLKAALADATCADHLSYTQQVGDIDATYQLVYIKQHEAELAQTRQLSDQRVANATKILQDAGVL